VDLVNLVILESLLTAKAHRIMCQVFGLLTHVGADKVSAALCSLGSLLYCVNYRSYPLV